MKQQRLSDPTAITLAVIAIFSVAPALAQQDEEAPEPTFEEIEEVTVTGRFISASQELVNERLADAFSTDLLGAETISRLGDSTVASALRRVPGLTLVQDKFVYIRGLGERYSQSTQNGAQIPSPDLTRNVIPLDVFPTSIVESLRVQKSWAPHMSANFGGGAVDIRTKGIPDALTVKFEVGLGQNSENPSRVNSYSGGGDDDLGTDDGTRALSSLIDQGIVDFQGNPSVNSIFTFLQRQNASTSLYDAQLVNRELALALNRDISITRESTHPDYKFRATVGNRFELGNEWEAGFNVSGSYGTDWRFRRTYTADFGLPEEQNGIKEESTQSVNIAGTLGLGVSFAAEHDVTLTSLFLRNTDDETEIFDFFNENRPKSSGRGFRDYRLQFEEREMVTHQLKGSHFLGEAMRGRLPFLAKMLSAVPEDTKVEWFYSTSEAVTEIPNQVEVASETFTDRTTGAVLSESVRLTSSAADYRFTDLDDEVEHYGWRGTLPVQLGNSYVELSGGWDHAQKSRAYRQVQLSLGYLEVADQSVLEGPLGEVFSDENIIGDLPDSTNPVPGARVFVNNAVFDRQGTNSNSYIAATMTDSAWGQVDWTVRDQWRIAVGARWEDYRQAAVDWNPYGFSLADAQVTNDEETLANGVFNEDRVYPSVGLTYMGDFWAERFQLRLGYSETAVRPDLREITDSSYIDPITGDLVRGNPGVVPAKVDNIDLRAEWHFGNGDNLTATLFSKDIANPIEFFEIPASDTTIAREIVNASAGKVEGVELEFLKELGFLGGVFETLFVQGNVTFQDSELVAGPAADNPTNSVRSLSGASDYVANVMLGFDSPNAKHTASLIYNVFGERLYVAGRLGSPDGYEQPFHSLDFTYFWYPTDRMTVKLKAQNLLNETITIERAGIVTFEEDPGTSVGLSFSWAL
ncbi:MAG: TonB-dependent receptor [Woeseiaceae bacterium]|nr:TonB-dependent receptor [Woeseiaceae bacterium]